MQNHYPAWKNLLLIALFVIGLIYSIPSLFGEDPAVQISTPNTAILSKQAVSTVKHVLDAEKLKYRSLIQEKDGLIIRFFSTTVQLRARDEIKNALGDKYTVALNLAPRTPRWLEAIGAYPIKLGLDLRGGVHFLLEVDVDSLIKAHEEGDLRNVGDTLRSANIRYAGLSRLRPRGLEIMFRSEDTMNAAYSKISDRFPDYQLTKDTTKRHFSVKAVMTQAALNKIVNYAIDQTMNTVNHRVNALGVSEALVQRQGRDHISVDLPGIQDMARAKSIIGKVATLRFQLVDSDHDVQSAMAGNVPIGSKLYMDNGRPILLHNRVILSGDSIVYATASFDQSGRPSVNVRLGGGDISMFNRVTGDNVGKQMAVIYVETKTQHKMINGKMVPIRKKTEKIISVATIDSALGNNFQITGLQSVRYAQNLALGLRSGALLAPISIVQEMTVGPSMGANNIHLGLISVIVGFLAVVIFMLFYYHLFGLFADMALFLNLVFIIAIFSLLGVTLTLPGIAAMVLTVGMAVDANVLIYERIREELRNGVSPQASIHMGYDMALSAIVDGNVTTLIVALVLYTVGSGSVKGFALTLIVGLLTSMVTAIIYTRAVVNWIYGSRNVKKLSIGIKNGIL